MRSFLNPLFDIVSVTASHQQRHFFFVCSMFHGARFVAFPGSGSDIHMAQLITATAKTESRIGPMNNASLSLGCR